MANIEFEFNGETYNMTERNLRFAQEYVKNGRNATKAAIKAGYKEDSARTTGSEMLTIPAVKKYVDAYSLDLMAQLELSTFTLANELKNIALSDYREFFDEHGELIPIHKLSDRAAAALSGIEIEDDRMGLTTTKKIKTYDKTSALTALAKMLNIQGFDKVATVGKDGKLVDPNTKFIMIDPSTLSDEQLKTLLGEQAD